MAKTTRPKKQLTPEEEAKASFEKGLDKFKSLAMVAESDGGKILIQTHMKDVMTAVNKIADGFSKFTLQEFIAQAAIIKVNLASMKVLMNAPKNRDFYLEEMKSLLEGEAE